MSRRPATAAFTLLEVMIAVAILAMALTVIAQAQQRAMRQVLRAKMTTIATLLAREKMVATEEVVFEEGFSDFDKEKKGDFKEEGFEHFRYVLKIDKIEIPTGLNGNSVTDMLTGGQEPGAGDQGKNALSGMAKANASLLGSQFDMFRNLLEQTIRRVTLTVFWKEGSGEQSIGVDSYFTDTRKLGAGGLGALLSGAGLPGGQGQPGGTGLPGSMGTTGTPGALPFGTTGNTAINPTINSTGTSPQVR